MRNSIFYRRTIIMKKTTAKVEYLDHATQGFFGASNCYVHFSGFRADEMTHKWFHIKHTRFFEFYPLYKQNKNQIQNLRNQIDAINAQEKSLIDSKPSKPFYRFWYNKAEKERLSEINKLFDELSKQADELTIQANKLEKENEEIKDKSHLGLCECRRKIKYLLKQHGFVLTSTSSKGNECVTEIEVWTLEE